MVWSEKVGQAVDISPLRVHREGESFRQCAGHVQGHMLYEMCRMWSRDIACDIPILKQLLAVYGFSCNLLSLAALLQSQTTWL